MILSRKSTLALCLAATAVFPGRSRADTTTIGALKDATIFQNNVNNSSGRGPGLFAGTNGSGSPRRSLIEFDVADNVPAGATITAVQFNLTVGQLAGSGGGVGGNTTARTINLFDLSSDWGEGTTGASSTINGTGQGVAASTGDATWNANMFNLSNWNTPGGDHGLDVRASLTLATPTVNTTYTWSSAGLVADVQNWLNAPSSNHGWELINQDETTLTNFLAFYSKDGLAAAGNNANYLPQLLITYDAPTGVPEPGSAVWVAAGLLVAVVSVRLRRGSGARPS